MFVERKSFNKEKVPRAHFVRDYIQCIRKSGRFDSARRQESNVKTATSVLELSDLQRETLFVVAVLSVTALIVEEGADFSFLVPFV